ncbi:MAG: YezD family protein [Thermodesulfobacteriota bacterium]|nr:YezD family protein [Thermodesulfobacteriota bacterium]
MEKAISNFKINEEELLSQILKAIRSIRYGYVQIIVQDSKVVQIDKTEKIRLDKEDSLVNGRSPRR